MGRPGLSRHTVIAAAAELADESGFDAVAVSTLARRLGIKAPTLYSHVSGLQDLRTAVAALALDELADLMSEAVEGRSAKDATFAHANAIRDYARGSTGRYQAATRQPVATDPAKDPTTASAADAIAAGRRTADLALAVVRSYGIADERQVHAVRVMGSLIHGFISLELAGSFDHSDPPSEETWTDMLDGLDRALASQADEPG